MNWFGYPCRLLVSAFSPLSFMYYWPFVEESSVSNLELYEIAQNCSFVSESVGAQHSGENVGFKHTRNLSGSSLCKTSGNSHFNILKHFSLY